MLGALLRWSREVATLTIAIALVLFGAVLLYAIAYALRFHDGGPLSRMTELVLLLGCLRFLIAPPPRP
jgi:hypothetical protein